MATHPIPIETHYTHSERLITQAEQELAQGDRLQASEKAWGAVAHRMKAIAEQRGWEYISHAQVFDIVERLAEETGSNEVRHLFAYANGLHRNYYVDATPIRQLEYEIAQVKRLLEMLKRAESRNGV